MSEREQGILILVSCAALLAVPAHLLIRRLVLASLASGVAASLLFQVLVTVKLGYVDPFAPIAFVVGGFLAVVVGLLVGVGIRMVRAQPEPPG